MSLFQSSNDTGEKQGSYFFIEIPYPYVHHKDTHTQLLYDHAPFYYMCVDGCVIVLFTKMNYI